MRHLLRLRLRLRLLSAEPAAAVSLLFAVY
jgi:hypothetical protein